MHEMSSSMSMTG